MPSPRLHFRSLKLRLLLPYAALIVALTGVIGSITYFAGARTVTTLSDQMLREMAARMQQNIHYHVNGSAAVLEAVFPNGMAAPADISRHWLDLRNRLWAAATLYPDTNNYVYYANEAGQAAGLKLHAPASDAPVGTLPTAELRVRMRSDQHRRFYRLERIHGEQHYLRTESTLFDARLRPWYQKASQVDNHTWTSVYIDFGTKDLVLTRARRVLNAQGQFEGVVATDVSLRALQHIVDKLSHSVQGRAFIVEPSGEIIAASHTPNILHADAGRSIYRVAIHSSADAQLRSIYEKTLKHALAHTNKDAAINAGDPVPPNSMLLRNSHHLAVVHSMNLVDQAGIRQHVAYVRVHDDAGLDWLAIVAVPRSTILAQVSSLVSNVVWAGLGCLVLSLIIGIRLFGRVADDVRSLSKAVSQVGQGVISTPIDTHRPDEVGDLARSFGQMRQELFTDRLTGVANRSALQHVLTSLTSKPPSGLPVIPFALLFIDLNLFKLLNDRWGHDNGDLALQEVAQRLQQQLRGDDVVARLGGDEFVVVLHSVGNIDTARTISAKLVEAICAPLTTLQGIPEGTQIRLGASVGIAMYPHDAQNTQSLLKKADQKMYAQKAQRPVAEQR